MGGCVVVTAVDGVLPDLRPFLAPFARRLVRANRLTESHPDSETPEAILSDAAAAVAAALGPEADRALSSPDAPELALVLAAQRALARGEPDAAVALCRRAAASMPNDLAVQRLMARAEEAAGAPPMPDRREGFCRAPFESLETAPGGEVFFCCQAWLPKPIGNLGDAGPEELWNSAAARDIRASVHDGSYRHCSRVHCPKLSAGGLEPRAALPERLRRIASSGSVVMEDGPRKVVLSHDRSCNLACPSCRTGLVVARKKEQARLNALADRVILPLLAGVERVRCTASGDPFGSAHFQYLLRNLDRAGNDRLRLDLQTNGLLLTPKLWEDLRLEGRVDQLIVSADAARAETYAEVRRGGRFRQLLDNLAFFRDLRAQGRLRLLRLDFVVQASNFAEMPAFVDLAREYGCDGVKFQMIRNWGTWSGWEFAAHDISDPDHPHHRDFLAVLRSLAPQAGYAEFWGMAAALQAAAAQAAAPTS